MISILTGGEGCGKTKKMLHLIDEAKHNSNGSIVCIDKAKELIYDLDHGIRLVVASEYNIESCDSFYGLICGLLASNYDITHIFVDSVVSICGDDLEKIGRLLEKLEAISEKAGVDIVFATSADNKDLPKSYTKFKLI